MSTEKDKNVLDMMFDPYLVESSFSKIDCDNREFQSNQELTNDQLKAKELELNGVKLANENQLSKSLTMLSEAVALWPNKASIYNNRAQVFRLLNQINAAKKDLDEAIRLADDETNLDRLVARQAYCQRGLIFMLEENQQQALKDMTKSAQMGNRFARSYLAKMNPYAALCNKMLKEMFAEFQIPKN